MNRDLKNDRGFLEFWDDSEALKHMIDNYKRQRKIRNFLIYCGDIQPSEEDFKYVKEEKKRQVLNELFDSDLSNGNQTE